MCADTFRAGAFDQLKQNATKAKIPFYGRYLLFVSIYVALTWYYLLVDEEFDGEDSQNKL